VTGDYHTRGRNPTRRGPKQPCTSVPSAPQKPAAPGTRQPSRPRTASLGDGSPGAPHPGLSAVVKPDCFIVDGAGYSPAIEHDQDEPDAEAERALMRAQSGVVTEAIITCPLCSTQTQETMPEDACQHFYVCMGCGEMLTPKPGDCCVFCSYADSPCPPMQAEGF
jgi:hypothetical protein